MYADFPLLTNTLHTAERFVQVWTLTSLLSILLAPCHQILSVTRLLFRDGDSVPKLYFGLGVGGEYSSLERGLRVKMSVRKAQKKERKTGINNVFVNAEGCGSCFIR